MLDMSEYFYRDMELKDFYILDKLGADGMYFFPSGLQVITCYGMESVFGGMEGWSIDEYMVMNSQPQYAASPAESQESFLRVMGHSLISNWVDWESMSCSFDDGEFAKLLEFAAGLPQDESLDQTDASRMLEVSGGSLLYDRFWFSSPHQYRDLEREAQAQLSFIGYPTADGSCGSFIYLARLCGVCAGTEYPDEAWEFIKYLISDEDFQNSELFTNIPLRKSVLKAHIDYLLDPYAQYEGKDIVIHEDGTFSVDGEYMDLIYDPSPYLTERQAENIYKLIDSAHIFYEYDPNIQSIVESGAKSFFAGDKSLEACVADIQSRVSLYLAEQSA